MEEPMAFGVLSGILVALTVLAGFALADRKGDPSGETVIGTLFWLSLWSVFASLPIIVGGALTALIMFFVPYLMLAALATAVLAHSLWSGLLVLTISTAIGFALQEEDDRLPTMYFLTPIILGAATRWAYGSYYVPPPYSEILTGQLAGASALLVPSGVIYIWYQYELGPQLVGLVNAWRRRDAAIERWAKKHARKLRALVPGPEWSDLRSEVDGIANTLVDLVSRKRSLTLDVRAARRVLARADADTAFSRRARTETAQRLAELETDLSAVTEHALASRVVLEQIEVDLYLVKSRSEAATGDLIARLSSFRGSISGVGNSMKRAREEVESLQRPPRARNSER